MTPAEGGCLLNRIPPRARPAFRVLLVIAGLAAWMFFQGLLLHLLDFFNDYMIGYAVAGFLSVLPLVPLWMILPTKTGVRGLRKGGLTVLSASVLFIPFVIMALRMGMSFVGISQTWFIYSIALLGLAAMEETVCRGFLMDALSFRGNSITGLLISSVIFAMLHLGNEQVSPTGIFNIFLAGSLFGLIRSVSGGLAYPIAVHWLWNLMTGMVFGWNVSGYDLMPTIFKPLSAPPWGGFGPEESLLMTLGTLGGILILVRYIVSSDHKAFAGIGEVAGDKAKEVDP